MNAHPHIEAFLNWLFGQSLQVSVLVAFVLAVQRLLRRQLTARWRFALWFLVLGRLLLPFGPESAFSVFNFVPPAVTMSGSRHPKTVFADGSDAAVRPPSINPSGQPIGADIHAGKTGISPVSSSNPAVRTPRWSRDGLLMPGLFGLWLVGATTLTIAVLVQCLRFHRRLRPPGVVEGDPGPAHLMSGPVVELMDSCRQEMGVHRRVQLLETDTVKSPALFGLFRLRLLLPIGLVDRFDHDGLRHVFLHELAHVKRGDLWLNWLVTALQIVHWFNPVLWLGFARLRADRELACDELALIHAGEGAGESYGETIIRLLDGFSRPAAVPGLIGIAEDQNQMKRRIRMIAAFRKPSRWSAWAALLMIGLGLVMWTDAQTRSPAPTPESPAAAPTSGETSGLLFRVLDAANEQPLPRVLVKADWNKTNFLTDAMGSCVLPRPARNSGNYYRITISRDGYVAKYVSWSEFQRDSYEDIPAEYTAHLDQGAVIGGTVQNEQGQGIAGVRIVFSGPSPVGVSDRERTTSMGNFHTETTDAAGRWRCDHVPVKFQSISYALFHPDYITGFYQCEETDEPHIGPIKLPQARLADGTAVMVLHRGRVVSGTVVNRAGEPIPGARITVDRRWSEPTANQTNDTVGAFTFRNVAPGKHTLTVQAKGWAGRTETFDASSSPARLRVVMAKGPGLLGRVVDPDGRPIPRASIEVARVDFRDEAYLWATRTDTNGAFTWDSAPIEPQKYEISAPGHVILREVELPADGEEHTITLQRRVDTPSVTLSGTVTDAGTGLPVPRFTLKLEEMLGPRLLPLQRDFADPDGHFSIRLSTDSSGFSGAILADGYQTEPIPGSRKPETNVVIALRLKRGVGLSGTVFTPDGRAAAGAELALLVRDKGAILGNRRLLWREQSLTSDADRFGRFTLPYIATGHGLIAGHGVVAVHKSGFARVPVDQPSQVLTVQLQPWGRIEGQAWLGPRPASHQRVSLNELYWNGNRRDLSLSPEAFIVPTDHQGRFIIESVPPGEWEIGVLVPQGGGSTISHPFPIVVDAGKTATTTFGGTGRPVVGRILNTLTNGPIDWAKQAWISSIRLAAYNGTANRPALSSPEDYNAYWASEAGRAYQRGMLPYALVIQPDGSFRAEDVPAGDYELEIGVYEPPKEQWRMGKQIGRINLQFTMLEMPGRRSDDPLDLGVIPLSPK